MFVLGVVVLNVLCFRRSPVLSRRWLFADPSQSLACDVDGTQLHDEALSYCDSNSCWTPTGGRGRSQHARPAVGLQERSVLNYEWENIFMIFISDI